jgi:branched-chain amino acid transport system substrate-binding protein
VARVKALPKVPDFLYVAAMPYNVGLIVKQLRAAGYAGPIVGGDGYDTPDLVGTAGAAADGVYFTTHAFVDAERGNAAMKRFIADYQTQYHVAPDDAFAALGYDATRLLADAIGRAGKTDAAAIGTALEATRDFAAVTGSISLSAASHIPKKTVTVIAIKDGKYSLADERLPKRIPAAFVGESKTSSRTRNSGQAEKPAPTTAGTVLSPADGR